MTAKKRIGALVIGQSPRPDLVAPLQQLRPDFELLQAGALDGVNGADIPTSAPSPYPLLTLLRDGTQVKVDEADLTPLLQTALSDLEAQEVLVTILLCAGSFEALQGQRPLLKPFDLACATLRSMGLVHLGVICPLKAQEAPLKQRWQAAGFKPVVQTTKLEGASTDLSAFQQNNVDCLILDYVGHPPEQVQALKAVSALPILDLGGLTMSLLAELL